MGGEGIKSYRDLRIWQESILLAKDVYVVADLLPDKERFGLRSQLTRAAVSIASNIAEGSRRKGTKELVQFLGIAHGSLAEIETQLTIAIEVGYIAPDKVNGCFERTERLSRGIKKLQQTLEKR